MFHHLGWDFLWDPRNSSDFAAPFARLGATAASPRNPRRDGAEHGDVLRGKVSETRAGPVRNRWILVNQLNGILFFFCFSFVFLVCFCCSFVFRQKNYRR